MTMKREMAANVAEWRIWHRINVVMAVNGSIVSIRLMSISNQYQKISMGYPYNIFEIS